jgi:hypothetical protein
MIWKNIFHLNSFVNHNRKCWSDSGVKSFKKERIISGYSRISKINTKQKLPNIEVSNFNNNFKIK